MKKILLFTFLLIGYVSQAQRSFKFLNIQQPIVVSGPNIVETGSLSDFANVTGTASSTQVFSFVGTNLTGSITYTAGTATEVSADNVTFGGTAVYTQSGGNSSGNVYVRVKASNGVNSGSSSIVSSGGGSGVNTITVPYNWNTSAAPSLSSTPLTLTLGSVAAGTASASQTTTVTFGGITVTATPPNANVELSKDGGTTWNGGGTGISFSSGSPLALKARIPTTASVGSITGNIVLSGSGVSSVNVAVTGTVTSSSPINDTINLVVWDSVHSGTKFNSGEFNNNYSPVAPSTGLTSRPLLYGTGVQSPITLTVGGLNDVTSNPSTYGNGNTMIGAYPAGAFLALLYSSPGNLTLTYANVSAGTYRVEIVSGTSVGSGPYNATWTSGAASQGPVNGFNNTSTTIVLDNLTPSSGNIVITGTQVNGFVVMNTIRLIRKN